MPAITVSVINACSVVTDDECQTLVAALQKQVARDFAPVWGIDAKLVFVPAGGKPDDHTWWLSILDSTDRAGVLGHHDLTPAGLPVGKSFAGTDKHYGHCWTVTASHELLEMLVDPDINMAVLVHPTPSESKLYAYEVCDACQDDSFGYDIDGVMVGDFVYPAYFESFHAAGSTTFDHLGKLQKPAPEVLPGGYISMFDMNSATGWHPVTAATLDPSAGRATIRGRTSSRRERRRMPRSHWVHSTAFTKQP
ncbi:MAG TPA: hypothetical protein VK741_06480 [Acetobacteraceae bacterium]|jgi:hypothetical protein|nr:hypothetical protein [Acetobacteraceae bacterium]